MAQIVVRLKPSTPDTHWDEFCFSTTYSDMETGKKIIHIIHKKLLTQFKDEYICIRFCVDKYNEFVYCNYRLPSWCKQVGSIPTKVLKIK